MSEDLQTEVVRKTLGDRAALYRMLAQLYFKPLTQEQIDALAEADLAVIASEDGSPFADGYNDLYRYLRKRNTGTRQELASDYTATFYGTQTYKGRAAQPFESLYRYGGGFVMGEASGEVHRVFRESYVRVKEGLDLPDDHLSFLFEFMARQCDGLSDLIADGRFDEALQSVLEQQAFFDAHVASWFPRFKALASKLVSTRFYRGCLKITQAFVEDEPDAMAQLENDLEDLRSRKAA